MQLPIDPEVYRTLEQATPGLVAWLALFTLLTVVKVARHALGHAVDGREGMITSELPGLPLMLLHSAGFGLALWHGDPLSAALFAWWGPGYLVVAATLLVAARRKRRLDWRPLARATSWACKLSYVVFMAIYGALGLPGLPFVFSAWIIHDQVKLAWLRGNADRTRRVAEDAWLPRVLYAALLGLPFVANVPLREVAIGLALVLGPLWAVGLARVIRSGRFRERPDPEASDNLRDIVYLARRPVAG
ncbi:MAG: hypothetical protein KF878_33060 [Planctomycetes bacterium]|nr:hypothetical protein [Planctomycetota bacterium]